MSGAFDRNGTPNDFSDDRPRGHAAAVPRARELELARAPSPPARRSPTASTGGRRDRRPHDRRAWLASGAPSLEGVRWLGSVYHQGRGAGRRGRRRLRLDPGHRLRPRGRAERVGPLPDRDRRARRRRPAARARPAAPASTTPRATAACTPTTFEARSTTTPPTSAEKAFARLRARRRTASKAIFRVPIRTQPQASLCTAHVFHQIPGQNRIFMGWYSQGTHVVDFIEKRERHDPRSRRRAT